MNKYVEKCKPVGFDANLHKLDLFLPYNILAIKDGKQYDFTVEVRDLSGEPDCKIGDFYNNIWLRPKQALKNNWTGYQSYADISRAVKNCLIKRGFTILSWYRRNEVY